jgi:hypothetical protein
MKPLNISRNAVLTSLLSIVATWVGQGQIAPGRYPKMAPLAEYLMIDRDAEIRLAKTAAPPAISDHADVLVLLRTGYETAVHGTNGFVCVVERSWMGPFNGAEFWNPKLRGPVCFNPPAARSVLPVTYKRTELVLAGLSKIQMLAALKDFVDKKQMPPLEVGAMSYMMSRQSYLGDAFGHGDAHLMFYATKSGDTPWGENLTDSPVFLNTQFEASPEPIRTYIVGVSNWSDGQHASKDAHDH